MRDSINSSFDQTGESLRRRSTATSKDKLLSFLRSNLATSEERSEEARLGSQELRKRIVVAKNDNNNKVRNGDQTGSPLKAVLAMTTGSLANSVYGSSVAVVHG